MGQQGDFKCREKRFLVQRKVLSVSCRVLALSLAAPQCRVRKTEQSLKFVVCGDASPVKPMCATDPRTPARTCTCCLAIRCCWHKAKVQHRMKPGLQKITIENTITKYRPHMLSNHPHLSNRNCPKKVSGIEADSGYPLSKFYP